jgi:hypothetical protein
MYPMMHDNIAPNAIDMHTMMYDNIAPNAIYICTLWCMAILLLML